VHRALQVGVQYDAYLKEHRWNFQLDLLKVTVTFLKDCFSVAGGPILACDFLPFLAKQFAMTGRRGPVPILACDSLPFLAGPGESDFSIR
jgi:hypothetical protein